MLIDFSKLKKDPYGNVDAPVMMLETLHDEIICPVDNYYDLQLELKFAEPSKATFKVPAYDNGVKTQCYDKLYAKRKIDISPFGEFVLDEPKTVNEGVKEYKSFTASSTESLFASRHIIFEEGTYRFYSADDLAADVPATIMGIVHSVIPEWSISVDESLWSKYRTFEETDTDILSWLNDKAAKSFGCLFNFDAASKTLYVVDANADYDLMDIYLSYDNLLKSGTRTEFSNELMTVLDVYGADPVNIREVNPIGSNKIYNLDYFIENGDIHGELAGKWKAWQAEIAIEQERYTALQLMRNSAIMHYNTLSAKLRALSDDLKDAENRIDSNIRAYAIADDQAVKSYLEEEYADLITERDQIESDLTIQSEEMDAVQDEIDSHGENIKEIVARLSYTSYFTKAEQDILRNYFLEDDFSDSTFAVFDVDVSTSGDQYESADSCSLSISTDMEDDIADLDLSLVDPDNIIHKQVVRLNGGVLTLLVGDTKIQTIIISGTFERDAETGIGVCSIYSGKGKLEKNDSIFEFVNSNISIAGECDPFESSQDFLTNAVFRDCSVYFTRNTTAFESYAVQKQLYDYAMAQHRAIAYPSGQFDISSGNILFAKEFEQYKDDLRLGRGLYLDFDDAILTPLLLEVQFSFDDATRFNLVFSNTYRRHDNVKNMQDLLKESRSTSRALDMAKYNYGAYSRSGAESEVKMLFQQGLNAATTQIVAGKDNTVIIDGSGIRVENDNDRSTYIKINNGMIALMDDNNQSRLAIGKFYDSGLGQIMFGVVAPNIVGTLLAGEYLQIQSPKFDGTHMYFSVDGNGVRLANGQFDIYRLSSSQGLAVSNKAISLDPSLGILAGNLDRAIAYDSQGNISGVCIAETQGSSANAGIVKTISEAKASYSNAIQNLTPNFWVDLNGDAFFRGTIYATDGVFSGKVYATDGEFTGTIYATDGEFSGTLKAPKGALDAAKISTSGMFTFTSNGVTYGKIGQHSGSTGTQGQITTYGTAMYGKDNKFYVFASDYGVRMSNAANTNAVYVDSDYAVMEAGSAKVRAQNIDEVWIFGNKIVLYGNSVVLKDNTAVTSDKKTKNSISYDMDKYEAFYQNLKPAFYRVNHGSSGRYHLGLIANDVKQALEDAGLSTNDFAGYLEYDESDDDGNPTGDRVCALRYGEFISLNTYMIQKLIARVNELEAIVGGA